MPRPLDRRRQTALVPGTSPCLASRLDHAPVRDLLAEHTHVLVVYGGAPSDAEVTLLLAAEPESLFSSWSLFTSLGQGYSPTSF